jgi:hypothetical protein
MRTTLNQRIARLELPERMNGLPISDDGYPVPWFVPWINSKPEFRGFDGEKLIIAVRHKRCWMCGQPLGKHMTFAIGPMCMVNRNISEPPSHLSCIEYAVKACPFLTQPKMRRNEKDKPGGHIAGISLEDNPGLTVVWTTFSYKPFKPRGGGVLFEIGDPEHVEYYTEGRKATQEETLAVLEERIPKLYEQATKDGPEAIAELDGMYARAIELVKKTSVVAA